MAANKFDVLVVDDEPDKLTLFRIALEMAGYKVRTAVDGEAGLAAIASAPPDLIITDTTMPKLNGYELARRVRANPQTKFIPVIIQTAARNDAEGVRYGSEVGALGYITDPTDIDLLLARVRTLLDFKSYLNTAEESAARAQELQSKLEIAEEEIVRKRSEESARQEPNAVVMSFDFPEEVRVPCEQYLLYFVQFLKDIGVEATADLQHEAGKVLFAVTPANQEEALDKIRVALETYLRLAASPVHSLTNLKYEIAIQRLGGEIQSLQSRLSLARAELQFKEATIQKQQTTISHQRLLNDEVMLESMKNVTPQAKSEDKEELIKGILALGKFEKGGVQVNLAEVIRRLKRLFSKEGDE